MMKHREYCCCAIPLVNSGIYATLTEQFALGVIVATLAVATPSIVGAATPSFAPWLLAIVCYIGAAIQIIGFLGVASENSKLYRSYVWLHMIATIAAFAIAAAWVIISAARHSTAETNCENAFFPTTGTSSTTSSEGQTLCNIFTWVDVGVMAGAWVFFAITQAYFFFVVSSYGSTQRQDHQMYQSLNDSNKPLSNDIPMADRSDPWDSRASADYTPTSNNPSYGQFRNQNNGNMVAVTKDDGYNSYAAPSYPPPR